MRTCANMREHARTCATTIDSSDSTAQTHGPPSPPDSHRTARPSGVLCALLSVGRPVGMPNARAGRGPGAGVRVAEPRGRGCSEARVAAASLKASLDNRITCIKPVFVCDRQAFEARKGLCMTHIFIVFYISFVLGRSTNSMTCPLPPALTEFDPRACMIFSNGSPAVSRSTFWNFGRPIPPSSRFHVGYDIAIDMAVVARSRSPTSRPPTRADPPSRSSATTIFGFALSSRVSSSSNSIPRGKSRRTLSSWLCSRTGSKLASSGPVDPSTSTSRTAPHSSRCMPSMSICTSTGFDSFFLGAVRSAILPASSPKSCRSRSRRSESVSARITTARAVSGCRGAAPWRISAEAKHDWWSNRNGVTKSAARSICSPSTPPLRHRTNPRDKFTFTLGKWPLRLP